MKKKRKNIPNIGLAAATAILLFTTGLLTAQTTADALRYSTFDYGGTARFLGSGGALGALGTEFSTLSTNPAGLAMYRSSEIVFTPSILSTQTTSQLENDRGSPAIETSRTVFNINNFGFIVHSRPRNPRWKTVNFGIGVNHLGNYNQEFDFQGISVGSIVERWQERANAFGLDNQETGPAFDAGALLDIGEDGIFETDYELAPNEAIFRSQNVRREGSMTELVFSLGANYNERFMFGATVGVPFVSFEENKEYFEEDIGSGQDGSVPFFEDLTFREELQTTGVGVNFKLGAIFRPVQALRIGAAVHSPTSLSLDDEFTTEIIYAFREEGQVNEGSGGLDEGLFDYKLSTPWRFIGNLGVVIKKYGFLNASVELVDYGSANFKFENFPEDEAFANEDIELTLGQALNVRLGGEIALDIFRIRGGVNILPSPFDEDDSSTLTYQGGLGIRSGKFFADLAYRYRNEDFTYIPYTVQSSVEQIVNNEVTTSNFLLTVGLRY